MLAEMVVKWLQIGIIRNIPIIFSFLQLFQCETLPNCITEQTKIYNNRWYRNDYILANLRAGNTNTSMK